MKTQLLFILLGAFILNACQKCINYEAAVISFADDGAVQNFPYLITLDSAKTDTVYALQLKITNGSFAVKKIHISYIDFILKSKSTIDSVQYATKKIVVPPSTIQPFDEYFYEKILFKLQKNHKYQWQIYVSDEKGDKFVSNIVIKSLIVK